MAEISETNKIIAGKVGQAFGRLPKITTMWDADNRASVYVGAVIDSPHNSFTAYSTLNLSDWPLYVDGRVHETRIEMMGAAPSEIELFENAVSTAAFCIINQKWECYPGAIFPDVLAMYHLSPTMKHILFTEPFLFSSLEEPLQLPDRLVSWLMMVPIADSEYEYAKANGWLALGQLFEDLDIDYLDIRRLPIV
jgi:hypothetical protein